MKIIMPIPDRLKYVRTYYDFTQKYIAKILNISQSTYSSYEINRRIIPLKYVNTLSNFYNVSLDYLLGITDKNKNIVRKEFDSKVLAHNFQKIRIEKKLNKVELAKILNISETAVRDYENGNYSISTQSVYDFARKLNISIDWLLGKSDIKNIK